jgi:hypothetical protein
MTCYFFGRSLSIWLAPCAGPRAVWLFGCLFVRVGPVRLRLHTRRTWWERP